MLKFTRLLAPLLVASLFVQPATAFAGGRLLVHQHKHGYGYATPFAVAGPQYAAAAPQSLGSDLLSALLPALFGQLQQRIPQFPINFPGGGGGGGGGGGTAGLIVPEEVTSKLNDVEPKLNTGLSNIKKLAQDSGAVPIILDVRPKPSK